MSYRQTALRKKKFPLRLCSKSLFHFLSIFYAFPPTLSLRKKISSLLHSNDLLSHSTERSEKKSFLVVVCLKGGVCVAPTPTLPKKKQNIWKIFLIYCKLRHEGEENHFLGGKILFSASTLCNHDFLWKQIHLSLILAERKFIAFKYDVN